VGGPLSVAVDVCVQRGCAVVPAEHFLRRGGLRFTACFLKLTFGVFGLKACLSQLFVHNPLSFG